MNPKVSSTAHFLTIGGFPKPFQDCYQSFVNRHPTWTTILWAEKDVDRLLKKHNELEYFNSLTSFISKYNFAKYLILAENGGWYVDLDISWSRGRGLDDLMKVKLAYRRSIPPEKRIHEPYPEIFIPVRTLPRQKEVNLRMNDDCLLFTNPGHFFDLIEFAKARSLLKSTDLTIPYEPFGPRAISEWIHKRTDLKRIYMFEDEIQVKGIYCDHANSKSWIFS